MTIRGWCANYGRPDGLVIRTSPNQRIPILKQRAHGGSARQELFLYSSVSMYLEQLKDVWGD